MNKWAMMAVVVVIAFSLPSAIDLVSAQDPSPLEEFESVGEPSDIRFLYLSITEWTYISRTLQALFTVIAIIVGGVFAWRNAHIFRHREPHVNISHDISRLFLSDEYVYMVVTAMLHNTSRVNIEFLNGYSEIQQITPVSDEDVEELYVEAFLRSQDNPKPPGYVQWPTRGYYPISWGKDSLTVEPGEQEAETFEFIVSREIESVMITTYFYNPKVVGEIPNDADPKDAPRLRGTLRRWREVKGSRGWGRTSVFTVSENQTSYNDSMSC